MENFDIREAIHQSNLIEGYDIVKYDEQSLHAWNWLQNQEKLTKSVICHVQKMITLPQWDMQPNWRGYYRSMAQVNVRVGNHVPPIWEKVEGEMNTWLEDLSEEDPIWMHAMFERIHPFVDGNGRTGRMLLWWDQIRRNQMPMIIRDKNKRIYYDWLSECEKGL